MGQSTSTPLYYEDKISKRNQHKEHSQTLPPQQQLPLALPSAIAQKEGVWECFKDLKEFPPEVAINILSNLNATDLCLASCVWKDLAEDEILWKRLCMTKWKYASIYYRNKHDRVPGLKQHPVYKNLYLLLDEATLIFAFKPLQGIKYLIENHIVDDKPIEIAKFIQGTSALYPRNVQIFLEERVDVLEELLTLQHFDDLSLCDSLRMFFKKIPPPEKHGRFLHTLIDRFADKYYEGNDQCGFNKDQISVLCYSLLLLSVDLYSPHVKNKMSKREFIRNNRQVLTDANRDKLSDFYDDVYLNGHIVPNETNIKEKGRKNHQTRFPFYRPYGAIFEFKPPELKLICPC